MNCLNKKNLINLMTISIRSLQFEEVEGLVELPLEQGHSLVTKGIPNKEDVTSGSVLLFHVAMVWDEDWGDGSLNFSEMERMGHSVLFCLAGWISDKK